MTRAISIGLIFSLSTLLALAPAVAKSPKIKLVCARNVAGFHDAEMQFDVGGINNVDVTFLAKRPSKSQIDCALRDCLTQAIERDGTKDILATPWYRARERDNPNDDELLRPYGFLTGLLYQAADKSITIHKAQKLR